MYYIAFDGGGTKLKAILFDDNYKILSSAETAGCNETVYSSDEIDNNIKDCVKKLLDSANVHIERIEEAYSSMGSCYPKNVNAIIPCDSFVSCGEGPMGTLTSGITSGICALSGTGSDVFYVKDCEGIDALGGWGYFLGDEGSGFWIGQQALISAMRCAEGVEEPSLLNEMIKTQRGCHDKESLYPEIYRKNSPANNIASYCKIVNMAAEKGDVKAVAILKKAGILLAELSADLVKKHNVNDLPFCTTGSVFRHCRYARESYLERLKELIPNVDYRPSIFEPVIGGLLYCMLKHGGNIDDDVLARLRIELKDFCI